MSTIIQYPPSNTSSPCSSARSSLHLSSAFSAFAGSPRTLPTSPRPSRVRRTSIGNGEIYNLTRKEIGYEEHMSRNQSGQGVKALRASTLSRTRSSATLIQLEEDCLFVEESDVVGKLRRHSISAPSSPRYSTSYEESTQGGAAAAFETRRIAEVAKYEGMIPAEELLKRVQSKINKHNQEEEARQGKEANITADKAIVKKHTKELPISRFIAKFFICKWADKYAVQRYLHHQATKDERYKRRVARHATVKAVTNPNNFKPANIAMLMIAWYTLPHLLAIKALSGVRHAVQGILLGTGKAVTKPIRSLSRGLKRLVSRKGPNGAEEIKLPLCATSGN